MKKIKRRPSRNFSTSADASYETGRLLQLEAKYREALLHYRKAIELNPHHAQALINMGTLLQQAGRIDEAVVSYRKALSINPALVSAYNNLGLAWQEKGRYEEALACQRKALSLDPDHASLHFNMSCLLLLQGDFNNGWKEYEWRMKMPGYRARDFQQPRWDGSPLEGKTILLYNEAGFEGFGDTLQFIRYALLLEARGAQVVVECQSELVSLIRTVTGVKQVVSSGEALPDFDVHCPFLSLPFVFQTTIKNIPSHTPYLMPDASLVEKWQQRIRGDRARLRIGLAWAGDMSHPRSSYRSCPLEFFSPLRRFGDLIVYSLRKGGPPESVPEGIAFIDVMHEIENFSDTAALISNLDLVISVDTAVAHLAAAIGRPVLTLLPFVPDWRWLLSREDSPWYPSMKLFRQPAPGDWKSVINRICREIEKC